MPKSKCKPCFAQAGVRKIPARQRCTQQKTRRLKKHAGGAKGWATAMKGWSPRQESNLYLTLRRGPFYPLNYRGTRAPL